MKGFLPWILGRPLWNTSAKRQANWHFTGFLCRSTDKELYPHFVQPRVQKAWRGFQKLSSMCLGAVSVKMTTEDCLEVWSATGSMQGGDCVRSAEECFVRGIGMQPATHRILKTWLPWENYWNEMNLCIMNGFISPFQISISASCCDSRLGHLSALHTQKGLSTRDVGLNTVGIADFGKAAYIPSQWDFAESWVSGTCTECTAFPEVMWPWMGASSCFSVGCFMGLAGHTCTLWGNQQLDLVFENFMPGAQKPVTKDRILRDSIDRRCPEQANL